MIGEMFAEAQRRDPEHRRTWIVLVDGNNEQINAIEAEAARREITDLHIIVDYIHLTEYLGKAGHALIDGNTPATQAWVDEQLSALRVGRLDEVLTTLVEHPARAGAGKQQRKDVDITIGYLTAKAGYLDYKQALDNGWPIATGVVEGACRHLVGDRLNITGARWGLDGAEAVLRLRAIMANKQLDTYWDYHLRQQHQRNHLSRYRSPASEYELAA